MYKTIITLCVALQTSLIFAAQHDFQGGGLEALRAPQEQVHQNLFEQEQDLLQREEQIKKVKMMMQNSEARADQKRKKLYDKKKFRDSNQNRRYYFGEKRHKR